MGTRTQRTAERILSNIGLTDDISVLSPTHYGCHRSLGYLATGHSADDERYHTGSLAFVPLPGLGSLANGRRLGRR